MTIVRHKQRSKNGRKRKGFSLIEIIISMFILSMVVGGILSFNFQMIKAGYFSELKNQINRDIRTVTNELDTAAQEANYFVLYKSFDADDRNSSEDRLYDNRSGDFLVLVSISDASVTSGTQLVDKVVGYYRDTGKENIGPVQTFTIEYSTPVNIGSTGSSTLEGLFADSSSFTSTDQVLELTKGLARGRLFYNFENNAIMVNGQIYHGKNEIRYSDTYNFTISPRG